MRFYCRQIGSATGGIDEVVIEVKDPSRIDSNDVQRKRKAAEIWCKQRGMEYVLSTIE